MKTSLNFSRFKFLSLALIATLLSSITVMAQSVPEKVDVSINSGNDAVWYGQPWVWILGIAIFIVIIVAITRNNRSA